MQNKTKRALSASTIASLLISSSAVSVNVKAAVTPPETPRLWGSDRYETAVKVSQAGWTSGSDYVVVASGEGYADALCAAPLAKANNAPILLTEKSNLTEKTLDELKRLKAKHVFIIGGQGVVSQAVEDTIKANVTSDIQRLWGQNRYETSVKVAEKLGTPSKIVLASGDGYADALSAAPVAAIEGMPILLTESKTLSKATLDYIKANTGITKTYVIGGTASVSDVAMNAAPAAQRLGGADRFETNSTVLNAFSTDFDFKNAYVALGNGPTGNEFADALSASAIAAKNANPVIITNKVLSSTTETLAKSKLFPSSTITAIGGTANVPEEVITGMKITAELLSEAGKTYSDAVSGNAEITADNVTLKGNVKGDLYLSGNNASISNITVDGTIYINPGVTGVSNLNTVTAKNIVVLSGAADSVHFKNVKAAKLTVTSRDNVRITSEGTTAITNTVVNSQAILEAGTGSFGIVNLAQTAVDKTVEFRGSFDKAVIVDGNVDIKTATGAKIPALVVSESAKAAGIKVEGKGTITNIQVKNETAVLNIDKTISVTGKIEVINKNSIKSDNSSITGKVQEKSLDKMSDVITGTSTVAAGGGGGSSSSTTPNTDVDTATQLTVDGQTYTDNINGSGKIVANDVTLTGNVTGDLTVKGNNAHISGITVGGTLYVDPGSTGITTLDSVSAGKIVVLSGADHSIVCNNTNAPELEVRSLSNVRIRTTGSTAFTATTVASPVILDSQGGSFGDIAIGDVSDANGVTFSGNITSSSSITVSGQVTLRTSDDAVVPRVQLAPINSGSRITLAGIFGSVDVTRPGSVSVADTGRITGAVKIEAPVQLSAAAGAEVPMVQLAPLPQYSNNPITLDGTYNNIQVTAPTSLVMASTAQVTQPITVSADVALAAQAGASVAGVVIAQGFTSASGTGIQLSGSGTISTIQNQSTVAAVTVDPSTQISSIAVVAGAKEIKSSDSTVALKVTAVIKTLGDMAADIATAAVAQAEVSKTQADYTAAKLLVDALRAFSIDTSSLLNRLAAVNEAVAKAAVAKAQANKTQTNYDIAKALVDTLPTGTTKTDLVNGLAAVKVVIDTTKATAAVAEAEESKTQTDYDIAKALVTALADSDTKTSLISRLAAVGTAMNNANATIAVVKAEGSKKQADYDAAVILVSQLTDSTVQTALKSRLAVVKAAIDTANATAAVVKAEGSKTQVDYDAAKALVDALADGTVKTGLTNRLAVVKQSIDAAVKTAAETAATAAVVKAEGSKTQVDYDAAKALVDALADGNVKTDLTNRLAVVKQAIDSASNDITSLVSGVFNSKVAELMTSYPNLARDVSVITTANPIVITLNNDNLASLSTVFNNVGSEDINLLESRLTKAEELMNFVSSSLNIDGMSFSRYLAKAETSYVTSGGNSIYINTDGSFNINAIALKIKSSNMSYDDFKKSLVARIIAMCDETKKVPALTISASATVNGATLTMTKDVTTIVKDGTVIYDTSFSREANIDALLSLADATTGTYKVYCGNQYFTVQVTR